jgi:enoyl-CoA hydratase/carnithine racemase
MSSNRVEQPDSVDELHILCTVDAGVATLTLSRPAQYNALSSAMIAALQSAIDAHAARDDVRVIIIAAAGRAFCAGHDLREMRANPDQAWQGALFERCSALMMTIGNISQPVIAQVQGVATAAGAQLVAACDLALASHDARFATSGVGLGLFCSTPAVALTRNIAPKHAAELLFTGDFIDAQRAADIGLINHVVSADALSASTRAMALRVAAHSFHAVASGKKLLRDMQAMPLAEAYFAASVNMSHDMSSTDAKSGIDAFLTKAPMPAWLHR